MSFFWCFHFLHNIDNYANLVYGVATICHQVRCLRWGHPSHFDTATSLLIWYTMFCMRDISYRLIWMKFINMLSVYAQSGTHRRFNWWIVAVFCSDVCGDHRRPQTLAEICRNMGTCCGFRAVAAREKYLGFILLSRRNIKKSWHHFEVNNMYVHHKKELGRYMQ